jgi:hypothetical protein
MSTAHTATPKLPEPTLHEALLAAGYTAERVTRVDGEFRGMRILRDGMRAHETPLASAELGWEIACAALTAAHGE